MIPLHKILLELHLKGCFKNLNSVVELGSKDIWESPFGLNEFFEMVGKSLDIELLKKHIEKSRLSASLIWELMGFLDYECIDVDEAHGAHNFDLNYNLKAKYGFDKGFDVVTNLGTSEHVFNQFALFENVHNLCKNGGLMIHSVPLQMYLHHGLFNYQPDFFHHLAVANGYKPIIAYLVNGEYFAPYSKKLFESEAKKACDLVFVGAFAKSSDEPFKMPYQLSVPKELSFDYDAQKKSYLKKNLEPLLSLFGCRNYKNAAIFGTANAARIAKEFCDFAGIEVKFFIDDFKCGEYLGLKVIKTDEFLQHHQESVNVVVKGAFQKGTLTKYQNFRLQEFEIPQFLLN